MIHQLKGKDSEPKELTVRDKIREEYRSKRKELSVDECIQNSVDITNNFLKFWMFNRKTIHCFMPIHRLKEVDTIPLIKRLQVKGNRVCVPVSNFDSKKMDSVLLTEYTQFQDNSLGIPQPVNGEPIDTKEIDVVVVPLLAVDQHGNRLGYGKGFYDRFLALCREDTIFIGLTMFGIHEDFTDIDPHDVPLHYVVTPKGILKTVYGKRLENKS